MNILACKQGTIFSGKVINEWCLNEIKNRGQYYKEAKQIFSHYVFRDKYKYYLIRMMNNYGFMREVK